MRRGAWHGWRAARPTDEDGFLGGYYHASKYAVEAISDALRFEVRGFGVHVTLIEPG